MASRCVFTDDPVDPFDIVPDFGVDSREVWVGTADSPGNNALKLPIADEGATGITLWAYQQDTSKYSSER